MYRAMIAAGVRPLDVEAMEVWQAAAYFGEDSDSSTGLHGAELAAANFLARQRGEKLTPASATTHGVHGDAIRAALEAKRRAEAS